VRNLTTHVNDVVNLVKWKDLKDIILVGHSSAGFVITQAAEQFGPSVASISRCLRSAGWRQSDIVRQSGTPEGARGRGRQGRSGGEADPGCGLQGQREGPPLGDAKCTPHTLPVLDQRRPAAAILEHAVEQAVRYGILGQENADARDDVNHVRPVW
jgi:hypothetical protein